MGRGAVRQDVAVYRVFFFCWFHRTFCQNYPNVAVIIVCFFEKHDQKYCKRTISDRHNTTPTRFQPTIMNHNTRRSNRLAFHTDKMKISAVSLASKARSHSIFLRSRSHTHTRSGVPRNFVRWGGGGGSQQIQLRTEDRERGSGGCSPLVRGSEGSSNLVQEISFHIVKFS